MMKSSVLVSIRLLFDRMLCEFELRLFRFRCVIVGWFLGLGLCGMI